MNVDNVINEHLHKSRVTRKVQYNLGYKWVQVQSWLDEQVKTSSVLDEVALSIAGSGTDDEKALRLLSFVRERLTYTRDSTKWKVPEYWQDAVVTYEERTGDCEDGAVLLFVLMRKAGIISSKIYLAAGSVSGGGHAWIVYVPDEYPLNPVFLDWCYWPTNEPIGERQFYEIHGLLIRKAYLDSASEQDNKYLYFWWLCNDLTGIGAWWQLFH